MRHPLQSIRLFASARSAALVSIICFSWLVPSTIRAAEATQQPTAPAAATNLVQPESLEQGYLLVVEDKSKTASAASPIFIASSHNGWDPGDQKQKLEPRSDMRWQIFMPKGKLDSRLAFKFTRGSWDQVERTAEFKDIDNRLLPLIDPATITPGQPPIIELVVETWADRDPAGPARGPGDRYRAISVSAGSIKRLEVTGGGVPIMRDLVVWLPPGYNDAANASRTYPVLYLQDGQNLFEKVGAIPAEWGVDETAGALIAAGKIEPLIIVGIPNAEAQRIREYSPIDLVDNQPARGQAYVQFLVNEVKPRVERTFRVRTDAASTGIGGSSLGAVIALEAAAQRPDVFGKVLLESMTLSPRNGAIIEHVRALADRPDAGIIGNGSRGWPAAISFATGALEAGKDNSAANADYLEAARRFETVLRDRAKRAGNSRLRFEIDPQGEHNEQAWARRLAPALEFLYPAGK